MSGSMIQALPSIHGSLLGIGFALFAAYAIYAYQKLAESKKLLSDVTQKAKGFTSLSSPASPGEATLLDAKGVLDWVKVEKVLREVQMIGDSNLHFGPDGRAPVDEKKNLVQLYEQLMQLTDYFFISYPFCGDLIFSGRSSLDLIKKFRSDDFDISRIEDMTVRVGRLKKNWSLYGAAYISVAKRYSEYKFAQVQEEIDANTIASLRGMKWLHPQDIEDQVTAYIEKPKELSERDDYSKPLVEFFRAVFRFSDELLPDMREVVTDHHRYRDDFNFTVTCRIALAVFAVVFVLGIIVPMIVADVATNFSPNWITYLLAGMSVLPYFYVWCRLWRVVSKSQF